MLEAASQRELQSVVVGIVGVSILYDLAKLIGCRARLVRAACVDAGGGDGSARNVCGFFNVARNKELSRKTADVCHARGQAFAELLLQRQVVLHDVGKRSIWFYARDGCAGVEHRVA